LSFDVFRSGSCDRDNAFEVETQEYETRYKRLKVSDEAFEQRLTENPFFDYAAHSWGEHVRPVQSITSQLALAFLGDEALVAQGALTSEYKYEGYSRRFPNRASGLHLTAMYGPLYLTQRLLMGEHEERHIEVDSKDGDGQTPLSRAAWERHEAVVRLLVEADSKDKDGRTPLLLAAGGGHEAVVRLLVERDDVEADSKDKYGRTPLLWAAERGREAVVNHIFSFGIGLNYSRSEKLVDVLPICQEK
jgi:hypothetical protein